MIQIEKLAKRFGRVEAVRELSLHVPQGELFCFLGPNGAGKTTTIRMMCGLLRPDQGVVRLAGRDVQEDLLAARRLIGYIPDTPFLYERLTANEFYEFIGDLYGVDRAETRRRRAEAFTLFGLNDHAEALLKELSHGLRQRVIYAATLLHDPRVIIVDEPFIGLDPHSIRLIKNLLKEQTRQGVTVFMTTHILALVEDIADRVGILVQGRLAALGTVAELRQATRVDGQLEDIFLRVTAVAEDEAAAVLAAQGMPTP
jgi:ABC-2 type transport system ATP-binding protein